jgi:GxxExxY protein
MSEFQHKEITQAIIGAAFEVHNKLGYGFLEKVYQRAMQVELNTKEHDCELEHKLTVNYKGVIVGEFYSDLVVDEKVLVELKASKNYSSADEAQLLNQLKAGEISVGLLINFGREKVEFKRMIV